MSRCLHNWKTCAMPVFGLAVAALFLIPSSSAQAQSAASLYLSPSSGTYTVGNTFSVTVRVNTGGTAVNAAQATLVFDTSRLEVTGVSKGGSIFTLWTQDPVFSNSSGTIDFGGGLPTPGFSGSAGGIFTITFRSRIVGTTTVTLSSGSVLANDGYGTNVLSSLGAGTYNIVPELPRVPVPPPVSGVPAAPVVSSPTHPEENSWYSNNDPQLVWLLPSDITAISYTLDKNPTTNPRFAVSQLVTTEIFSDVDDGIWYFHINFRNQFGWGALTHRKILIDTVPPEPFEITPDDRGDPTHPQPFLHFEAVDATSGIDHYEISVEAEESYSVAPGETKPHEMPLQPPGQRRIVVEAVDRAGNKTRAFVNIFIESLIPPVITEYPTRIDSKTPLLIAGTSSYPDGSILIYIQQGTGTPEVFEIKLSDTSWSYVHPEYLEDGLYTIWAIARDERGALSGPSNIISLRVAPPAFIRFGRLAIDILSISISLLALILLLLFIIWYAWHRYRKWRDKLLKETLEAERALHDSFDALHRDLKAQFRLLERTRKSRKLTREEEKLKKYIDKDLKIAEELVQKEIKDIEKELD